MGLSIFSDDEYITFPEFGAFVNNALRYIEINACVWTPAQQSILRQYFTNLIATLENTNPVNPNLPWGSPGAGWPANNAVQEYFIRVRDAVPRSNFFVQTYPYTVNPYNSATPLPAFPTSQQLAQLFLLVAFFWGCFLSKDNAQAFLDASDYTTYVFSDAAGNVDFSSASTFIAAMNRIHFAGKEMTLPPNRMVILQDPAFLLTGRLIQFPRSLDGKCCEVIAADCMQRVNCGIYVTKLVRDVFCDVTCNDPCRSCTNNNGRGCYGQGTAQRTRYESEFQPEGRDARLAGDAGDTGQDRVYRENFITIRPFINSDLLVPQINNRLGTFGGYPWDLGLPDEFLTNREIDERRILENENPAFDNEIEPGTRGKRTQWVPCLCGSGLASNSYRGAGNRGGNGCSLVCWGGGGGGAGMVLMMLDMVVRKVEINISKCLLLKVNQHLKKDDHSVLKPVLEEIIILRRLLYLEMQLLMAKNMDHHAEVIVEVNVFVEFVVMNHLNCLFQLIKFVMFVLEQYLVY